jgi:hypothetical protein
MPALNAAETTRLHLPKPEPFVAVPKPEDKHYVPPFMPASPAAVVPFAPKSKPKS